MFRIESTSCFSCNHNLGHTVILLSKILSYLHNSATNLVSKKLLHLTCDSVSTLQCKGTETRLKEAGSSQLCPI